MINLEIQQEHDKTNKLEEDNNYKLISFSFYITYVFLLTTGTITFIEAMRTNDTKVRNILNLETCINTRNITNFPNVILLPKTSIS